MVRAFFTIRKTLRVVLVLAMLLDIQSFSPQQHTQRSASLCHTNHSYKNHNGTLLDGFSS